MKKIFNSTCLLSVLLASSALCTTNTITFGPGNKTTFSLCTLSEFVTSSTTVSERSAWSNYIYGNNVQKNPQNPNYYDLFLIDKDNTTTDPVLKHFYVPVGKTYAIYDSSFSVTCPRTNTTDNNLAIATAQPWESANNFSLSQLTFASDRLASLTVKNNTLNFTSVFELSMGDYSSPASIPPVPNGYLNPKMSVKIGKSSESGTDLSGIAAFLGNVHPFSYIIFGNNGLGHASNSYVKNAKQFPVFFPTLTNFSVITSDCVEELANNCLPVITSDSGSGATFPGAVEIATSYTNSINTASDSTGFSTTNAVAISSSDSLLNKDYATFPFPATWNNLNYDATNPLPGFSPPTIPNTQNQMLTGYQGATLPIQISALNKYYFFTMPGANYQAGDTLSFDFYLSPTHLPKDFTKSGRLYVTLKA